MNVLAFGASRNIGYDVCRKLLEQGSTVTYLLRRADTFDKDEVIKPFVDSGKAKLVIGDALSRDDVEKAWKTATDPDGKTKVDLVLSSVGAPAAKITLMYGAVIDPPNLVTLGMYNLLTTWPTSLRSPATQPKLIAVTANGATPASMANFMFPLNWVLAWFLGYPFLDKRGLEKVLIHAAGKGSEWNAKGEDGDIPKEWLPEGWEKEVVPTPEEGGWLKEYLVVRPAPFFGEAKEEGKYRVGEELPGLWSATRGDVSHFILEKALKDWDTWKGRRVNLGY